MSWRYGSSPHTRGAPGFGNSWQHARGIIPAYAGSTGAGSAPGDAETDHPRIRGEHGAAGPLRGRSPGSSPHTRGALSSGAGASSGSGIIPAYAGSTACVTSARRLSRDHPRIRGEHVDRGVLDDRAQGSSPHTRGAHLRQHGTGKHSGIIPAYAGSTWLRRRPYVVNSDHPRIRGEHLGR